MLLGDLLPWYNGNIHDYLQREGNTTFSVTTITRLSYICTTHNQKSVVNKKSGQMRFFGIKNLKTTKLQFYWSTMTNIWFYDYLFSFCKIIYVLFLRYFDKS